MESSMTNTDIIAVSAVCVALLALVTSLWQAVIARRHNRLSVRPFILATSGVVKNGFATLEVSNNGVGPAIIQCMKLKSSKFSSELKKLEDFVTFFENGNINLMQEQGWHATAIANGTALLPGKSIEIFKFDLNGSGEELQNKLDIFFDGIDLELKYKCIYGKEFSYKKT